MNTFESMVQFAQSYLERRVDQVDGKEQSQIGQLQELNSKLIVLDKEFNGLKNRKNQNAKKNGKKEKEKDGFQGILKQHCYELYKSLKQKTGGVKQQNVQSKKSPNKKVLQMQSLAVEHSPKSDRNSRSKSRGKYSKSKTKVDSSNRQVNSRKNNYKQIDKNSGDDSGVDKQLDEKKSQEEIEDIVINSQDNHNHLQQTKLKYKNNYYQMNMEHVDGTKAKQKLKQIKQNPKQEKPKDDYKKILSTQNNKSHFQANKQNLDKTSRLLDKLVKQEQHKLQNQKSQKIKSPEIKVRGEYNETDKSSSIQNFGNSQSGVNQFLNSSQQQQKRDGDVTEFDSNTQHNPNMQYLDTQEIEDNFKESNINQQAQQSEQEITNIQYEKIKNSSFMDIQDKDIQLLDQMEKKKTEEKPKKKNFLNYHYLMGSK